MTESRALRRATHDVRRHAERVHALPEGRTAVWFDRHTAKLYGGTTGVGEVSTAWARDVYAGDWDQDTSEPGVPVLVLWKKGDFLGNALLFVTEHDLN